MQNAGASQKVFQGLEPFQPFDNHGRANAELWPWQQLLSRSVFSLPEEEEEEEEEEEGLLFLIHALAL